MSNQVESQGLVPSINANPRLKWSAQLHGHFIDAVSHLGGADKATPKSVMRIMGIPGLTVYHLKSHLQKYRLAKNRKPNPRYINLGQDCEQTDSITSWTTCTASDPPLNASLLEMQIETQRKLQEQIEVQRHLQLRIEAQGKYLQSVLRKAQETLASYSMDSTGAESTEAELSELVSAVDTECSSFSRPKTVTKRAQDADCSTDSCLTSSERRGAKRHRMETDNSYNLGEESDEINTDSSKITSKKLNDAIEGNRSCSSISGEACVQQPGLGQKTGPGIWAREVIDLNI